MGNLNRDPERVISAIRRLHKLAPDMRVGQLISNALTLGGWNKDPFYTENDELAGFIERYCELIEEGIPKE